MQTVDKPGSAPQLLEALIADLTTLMGLHLQYKVYEWTVEGSSWFVHRSVFVDLGIAVARSIDLLADRIVGLGGSPVPMYTLKPFNPSGAPVRQFRESPQQMVAASLRTERKVEEALDEHRKLTQASDDQISSDILSHLLTKHGYHIKDLLSVEVDGLDPNKQWRWLNTGRKARTA